MERTPRLYFIDNLRILYITLVILLHFNITYGGPGSWYYREVEFGSQGMAIAVVSALFNMVVQAFSMGCFFMVAAYFTASSLERKGTRAFLAGRFIRLGIPLVVYMALIQPLTNYLAGSHLWEPPISFGAYLRVYFMEGDGVGTGPLWFVAALLLFSLGYLLIRHLHPHNGERNTPRIPATSAMIMFASVVGVISFVIRIWLPVGWSLPILGFQFPHFTQYIAMFTAGVLAYQGQWFTGFPSKRGTHWLIAALLLIVTCPVVMFLGGATETGEELFLGGMHWQSLYYSVWEQLVCLGIAAGLTTLFRDRLNRQGSIVRTMSASAYTVFIIHAPVLVGLGVALRGIPIHPTLKFLIFAPVAVLLSFMTATIVRKLPLADRVL